MAGETRVTVERGELRIDVQELFSLLGDEAKREAAKLIGADKWAWKEMAEALADEGDNFNKDDLDGWWSLSSESMLEIRQKLLPLMPEVARIAVEEAIRQRDDAKSDAERHQRWAWQMWHAYNDRKYGYGDPRPWPELPQWAHPAREEMRLRDAAPELLAAVIDLNAALAAVAVGAPLPADLVAEYQRRADAAIAKARPPAETTTQESAAQPQE